jgi:CheY-like chemotaxis protein
VADNGAGADPSRIRRVLSGGAGGDEVGLHNVDERLRTEFGDDYGLVIETGIGAGTTVSIRIPKFRARVGGVMSGLSVLTVDDERPSLDELSYLLADCARVESVTAVQSATEALRLLQQRQFDVVLLDIRMPGLDGLELAKVLAQFSRPPAIVFVTAHDEHALEAFEVGASGYLLKPVDHEQLAHALERAVPDVDRRGDLDEPFDVLAAESGNATTIVARRRCELGGVSRRLCPSAYR